MGMLNTNSHLEHHEVSFTDKTGRKSHGEEWKESLHSLCRRTGKVSQCAAIIFNPVVIFVNEASLTQDLVHAANKQGPEFK